MNLRPLLLSSLALLVAATRALAALPIPSDGSDGAFAPVSSVEIDLGQAASGAWDADNSANAGKGRYDASKWAIVFKYSSVNIPSGVTVTFKNHGSRAPVVWLVAGSVTIAGNLRVDGKPGTGGTDSQYPVEPGPGGFRGGAGGPAGLGVGYGPGGSDYGYYVSIYGNPQILPLIGGSGGQANNGPLSGGSGAGALLLACAGQLTLSGEISARGGWVSGVYPGSGGALRVIAESIVGSGKLDVRGGSNTSDGRAGRIRLETPSLASSIQTIPESIAVPPAATPVIWPPANAPTARILSVNSVAAPAEPLASLTSSADVAISNNTAVSVVVETKNFPIEGVVQVRFANKFGTHAWRSATVVPGGNFASANWTCSHTFAGGFTTVQARATAP